MLYIVSQNYSEIVNKTQMVMLIIQIYFVPFKVIPIRGNTHMPAQNVFLEVAILVWGTGKSHMVPYLVSTVPAEP